MVARRLLWGLLLAVGLCGPGWGQDAAGPVTFPDVKLMIVVPERHRGVPTEDAAAETELIRIFTEAQYTVIDQAQYASMRYTPRMEAVLRNPTGPEARSLTANAGADILIVGSATSDRVGEVKGGIWSCRAQIGLRAVVTRGEGQIIAAIDGIGAGADVAEAVAARIALRKAAARAGVYLLARIGQAVGGPTVAPDMSGMPQEQSSGKPRVAVLPFEDRSQWSMANWNLGQQIPDLIANELLKTGRVEVLERTNIEQVVANRGLEQSGLFMDEGGSADLATMVAAEYVIIGRITEFTTKREGGVVVLPRLGGTGLGTERARVNILIKVVNQKTGVVVSSFEARGEATAAVVAGGYVGIIFGGAQFDNTAAGRATRRAIAMAVRKTLDAIPEARVGASPAGQLTCSGCGAALTPGAKFCTQCGRPVQAKPLTCPRCHASVDRTDKFCGQCGARLNR